MKASVLTTSPPVFEVIAEENDAGLVFNNLRVVKENVVELAAWKDSLVFAPEKEGVPIYGFIQFQCLITGLTVLLPTPVEAGHTLQSVNQNGAIGSLVASKPVFIDFRLKTTVRQSPDYEPETGTFTDANEGLEFTSGQLVRMYVGHDKAKGISVKFLKVTPDGSMETVHQFY